MTWEVPPLWPSPRWSTETTPYPASVQRFACAALVIRDPPHPCPSSSTGTLRLAEAPAGLKMVKQILTGVREPGSGALAMQRFATLTALPPEPAAAISAPPGEAVLGGATSRELMSTVPTAAVRARTTAGRRDTLLLGWRRLLTPTAPDRFGLRPDGWRRCGRRSRVGHIRAIAHPRGAPCVICVTLRPSSARGVAVRSTTTCPGGCVLAVANLEVVYDDVVLALRGVSLEVPDGRIVALLGANGAGKSTVLRALSGLLDVHDGEIRKGPVTLDGRPVGNLRPSALTKRGVKHVLEGRRIFKELTVEENLRVGAHAAPRETRANLARVYDLFPRLVERKDGTAGYLSGGEQQMLAIG